MKAASVLAAAVAVGGALAQDRTEESRPSSTTSREPAVHTILVGKADHVFDPQNLKAEVGDTVTFEFYPANHSVIRSDFRYPCIPYEDLGQNRQGFFSGFFPVAGITDDMPQWNITINDTQPIFYYCSAPGSCINYGMIGAINPNSSAQVSEQANRAKQAKFMLQPGEPFPAEASSSVSAAAQATATVTTAPSSPASTTAATAAVPPPAAGKSGLGGGAIAGIVIGAIAGLALAGGLFFLLGRNRSLKANLASQRASQHGGGPETGYNPHHASAHQSVLPHYLSGATAPSSAPSEAGRWSHQQPPHLPGSYGVAGGLPPYAPQEMKSPHLVDGTEVGSIRSASPPAAPGTAPGTPYMSTFPPGVHGPPVAVGVSPPLPQGQWGYFEPGGVGQGQQGQQQQHQHQSVELSGSGVRGVFVERGLDDGLAVPGQRRTLHELEAQRGSLLAEGKEEGEERR